MLRVNISVSVGDMSDDPNLVSLLVFLFNRYIKNWNDSQKGLILSSFYWGYTIGQMPSARLAQIFGAKKMFGLRFFVFDVYILS